MYQIMKKIILNKSENKNNIQNKLDIFLAKNRISQQEYEELMLLLN